MIICILLLLKVAFSALVDIHPSVHAHLKHASSLQPCSLILYLKDQHSFHKDLKFQKIKERFSLKEDSIGEHVLDKLQTVATRSQKNLVDMLQHLDYVVDIRTYYVANIIVCDAVSSNILKDLEQRHDLLAIEPNKPFKVPLGQRSELMDFEIDVKYQQEVTFNEGTPEWHIQYVGAPRVWANFSVEGEGQVFASADTGVMFRHQSLLRNYRGYHISEVKEIINHNYAWYDGIRRKLTDKNGPCGIASSVPCDDTSHGSHTTSTAVGRFGIGVAPRAKWIACRNMDQNYGSPESYIACLQFFLAPHDLNGNNPKPHLRPTVIGNSYTCPPSENCAMRTFKTISENLRAAGIFMSVAAGNDGPNCKTINNPPAVEPLVITIGALRYMSNGIAYFSSRGPCNTDGINQYRKPDLVAPGSQIKGAYYSSTDDQYIIMSGTSMATPVVAGAVLLLTDACPCMRRNVDLIQEVLQSTAVHIPSGSSTCGNDNSKVVPNNVYGYGLINVESAVLKCKEICNKF